MGAHTPRYEDDYYNAAPYDRISIKNKMAQRRVMAVLRNSGERPSEREIAKRTNLKVDEVHHALLTLRREGQID